MKQGVEGKGRTFGKVIGIWTPRDRFPSRPTWQSLYSPSLTERVGVSLVNLPSIETYRHFRLCCQQGIAKSPGIIIAVVFPHQGYEILGQLLHWK
jgi:hypothetical protein